LPILPKPSPKPAPDNIVRHVCEVHRGYPPPVPLANQRIQWYSPKVNLFGFPNFRKAHSVQRPHSPEDYAACMIGGFGGSAVNHQTGNALVFELHGPCLAARQSGLDDHTQLDWAAA